MAANDIQGYKTYTLEMLAKWDPDVIIVQDRYPEVFNAITTDAKYAELSAVKNNKVLLSLYWAKPWGNPDTDSIALGELWLANQFYPTSVSKDTVKRHVHDFYDKFYGVFFKDEI